MAKKKKNMFMSGKSESPSASSSSIEAVSEDTIRAINRRILSKELEGTMRKVRLEHGGKSDGINEESTERNAVQQQTHVSDSRELEMEVDSGVVAESGIKESEQGKETNMVEKEAGSEWNKGVSFRDALAGNRSNVNGKRLKFVEGYKDGVIRFTKKDVEKTTAKWKLSLIGMVIGGRVSFNVVQNFVATRWTGVQAPRVTLTDSGVFVFRFDKAEDVEWVMMNGPWLLGGMRPLALRRWTEGIKLNPSCFESTQVWVSLPKLDVRFWEEEFYEKIGSAIGRPMFVDKVTESEERLSFARMLVEIEAKEPLKKDITFEGEDGETIVQPICYEWLPPKCDICKVFGHGQGECSKSNGFVWSRRQKQLHFQKRNWVRRGGIVQEKVNELGEKKCQDACPGVNLPPGQGEGVAVVDEDNPKKMQPDENTGDKEEEWVRVSRGKGRSRAMATQSGVKGKEIACESGQFLALNKCAGTREVLEDGVDNDTILLYE